MTTAAAASLASTENIDNSHLKRRGHRRVDDLSYLVKGAKSDHAQPNSVSSIQRILSALLKLNFSSYDVFANACFGQMFENYDVEPFVGRGLVDRLQKRLEDARVLDISYWLREDDVLGESKLRSYVAALPEDQAIRSIQDSEPYMYIRKAIHLQKRVCLYLDNLETYTKDSFKQGTLQIPQKKKTSHISSEQYITRLVLQVNEANICFKGMISDLEHLAESVYLAVSEGVSDAILDQVKENVESLDETYGAMQYWLDREKVNLVNKEDGRFVWHRKSEQSPSQPLEHQKAVTAYEGSATSTTATLIFLVPVVSLLCCVPVALAWTRASSIHGSVHDSDFFSSISNSAMQILSTGTLIWPTVFHERLALLPWVWTWTLALSSVCFSITAASIYCFLPTSWSAAFSFAASVAQALVTLQLVNAISSPRRHASSK